MMDYGYRQPSGPLDNARRFFSQRTALPVLIIINVAVWALVQVLKVGLFFFNYREPGLAASVAMHWLALPASVPAIIGKPWTLFSYMFLHTEFWHVLFNMLWLYWFGRIFLEFLSSRRLLWVYILGGIAGGLVYILAFNIFPVFRNIVPLSFALGASASVMAIVTAISFYVPDYTIQLLFIGRIRILYLALALFVFDFFMIPSGNPGGHLAHIGGALLGFAAVGVFRHSNKYSSGSSWFRQFSFFRNFRKSGPRDPFGNPGRPVSDEEYNLKKRENQKKIDEILEKISKGGYDSLSKAEKEFLFKSSNKH